MLQQDNNDDGEQAGLKDCEDPFMAKILKYSQESKKQQKSSPFKQPTQLFKMTGKDSEYLDYGNKWTLNKQGQSSGYRHSIEPVSSVPSTKITMSDFNWQIPQRDQKDQRKSV